MADKLEIQIIASDRASGAFKDVQKSAGGLAVGIGNIGKAAVIAGAALLGIAGVGAYALKGMVTLASDMNESTSKLEVVFGSAADSVKALAATSAQSMGLSQQATTEMAGTFGNLFTSMGLSQQASAGLSTDVLQLGADLASFNNIPVSEALEKIRSGLVGESEPLRSLGINLTEAAVANEAIAMKLDMSTDAAMASAKVQARYSLILKQSKNAQGDFARTSTGMANSLRTVEASFDDIRMTIGQQVLPIIAPLISAFAQKLPEAFRNAMPTVLAFGETVKRAASTVAAFIGYFNENNTRDLMREWFGGAGPIIDTFVRNIGMIPGAAANAFAGAKRAFEIAGWAGVAKFIGDGLIAEWGKIPWTAIWASAQEKVSAAVSSIGSIAVSVGEWLKAQWLAIPWTAIWAGATTIGSSLLASGLKIANDLTTWLAGEFNAVDWGKVWNGETVTDEIGGQMTFTKKGGIAKMFGDVSEGIRDWFVTQWNAIEWKSISKDLNKITLQAGDLLDTEAVGETLGRGLIAGIFGLLKLPFAWIAVQAEITKAIMAGKPEDIGRSFGTAFATGFGKAALAQLRIEMAPVEKWFRDAWTNLTTKPLGPDLFPTKPAPSEGPPSSGVEGPSGTYNGPTGERPWMPGFALGGTVPGPVGAPMLAMVHGGERVLTPGQQRGGNVNVYLSATVTGSGDEERLANTVAARVRAALDGDVSSLIRQRPRRELGFSVE